MSPLEASIVNAGITEIRERGGYHVATRKGGAGRVGVADLLVCYRGLFIALEAKQPGKRADNRQEFELESVRLAGGIATDFHDRAEVALLLDGIDKRAAA